MAYQFPPPSPSTAGHRNSTTVSPPPNAPNNHSTHSSFKQRATEHCSGRNLVVYIISIGTLILLIWQFALFFISVPQPQFHLGTLTISTFRFPLGPLTSGDLNAHFILGNPNSKVSLHYDRVQAAVLYNSGLISNTSVPGFIQGPKNKTAIKARFPSFYRNIVDRESIPVENKGDYVVMNFDFRMIATYRPSGWGDGWIFFEVHCHGLQMEFSFDSERGTLIGGWKNCVPIKITYLY